MSERKIPGMASDDQTLPPGDRIAELEQENEELRSRLERLEKQKKQATRVSRAVGKHGARILAGPELYASSRVWFAKLSRIESPRELASPETADLLSAIVRRVVRIGIVGLGIAALPAAFLLWQNVLFREQNAAIQRQIDQQAADTLIVRRAQLLATIYDEECEEDAGNGAVESTGDMKSVEPGEAGDTLRGTRRLDRVCRPRAHSRARREALPAFIEIERSREAWLDLDGANFSGTKLESIDLSNSSFENADFSQARLHGAKFVFTRLRRADLNGAELSWARFEYADLRGASLIGAKLDVADLRQMRFNGARLAGADFNGADLSRADLRGAILRDAINLTQEQIDAADGDAETILPSHLRRPRHWLSDSGSQTEGRNGHGSGQLEARQPPQ